MRETQTVLTNGIVYIDRFTENELLVFITVSGTLKVFFEADTSALKSVSKARLLFTCLVRR